MYIKELQDYLDNEYSTNVDYVEFLVFDGDTLRDLIREYKDIVEGVSLTKWSTKTPSKTS